MYIKIGNTTYREIRNLAFAPEIDISGDSLPINELAVDIKTADSISAGSLISLFDDLDAMWCRYWIKSADVIDKGFVHVEAMSVIGLLDRFTLPAAIYTADTGAYTLMLECFQPLRDAGAAWFVVDFDVLNAKVKGYFPEQSARERLQWLCLAIGAYVQQAFTIPAALDGHDVGSVDIKMLDTSTVTGIPMSKTYWKPSIEYKDYVTAINLTTYNFVQRTPTGDEEYVTVDDQTYVMTHYKFTLTNPDAPQNSVPNEVNVNDMTIVNAGNVSAIASKLSMLYFARTEVDADVINNKEYEPSQKISVSLDDTREAVGYIEETDFSFGVQAKSRTRVLVTEVRELSTLKIYYRYQGVAIAVKTYQFPEGYSYQIQNPYFNVSNGAHRYIYRPVEEYATGTIVAGENVNNQQVEIALHWYDSEKLLHIISVSDMEYDAGDKVLSIE